MNAPHPTPVSVTVEAHRLEGFVRVPIAHLHPSPTNPRERLTDIDELALSMREAGLIQPIIAQRIPGKPGLQIVAGHRRHAAARRLGWPDVPVIIRRDMLPDEELLTMIIENGQRAGLDPIEEARAFAKLKAQGLADFEIARKVGMSQPKVSGRLALLALNVDQQEELRAGQVTIGAAVQTSRINSGRVRPGAQGKKSAAHLSVHHPLAMRAQSRCRTLGHKKGGAASVGGIACGECWENVIRADERGHLHMTAARNGECPICGSATTPAAAEGTAS